MKIILAVNAGSSSVKISVYTADAKHDPQQLAEAQLSGLTAPPPKLDYTRAGERIHKNKQVQDDVKDQDAAFAILLHTLVADAALPQIARADDVAVACHRIVHGGDFVAPQRITPDTLHRLDALSDLAPLHNGPALAIVRSCLRQLPRAANVALFDSLFHASLPPHVRTYPIDRQIAHKNGLRKYGFHGISYAFITRAVGQFLGREGAQLNIIALHLGSGASACAIKGGKSWDTSMGLTPLAGLPGATRSGSVDPSLVFHYASDVGKLSPASTQELHISRAEEILNKESGWKALTGTTDFSAIAPPPPPAQDSRSDAHRLAFDLFVDRVSAFVGAYYVSLHGAVDALVFAGGIGERSATLRAAVAANVACLGFALDDKRNAAQAGDAVVWDVGAAGARHGILVCQTDEQFEMARSCAWDESLW